MVDCYKCEYLYYTIAFIIVLLIAVDLNWYMFVYYDASVTETLVRVWSYIRYGSSEWGEYFFLFGRFSAEFTVYKTLSKILLCALDVAVILSIACYIWHYSDKY